jgi:uncharacterized protein YjdB
MNTIDTTQYAPLQDGGGANLNPSSYSATSSDPAVASIGSAPGAIAVVGQSAGTATITAVRNADGATATLEVTVTTASGFTIQLGAPQPKG